MTCDYCGAYFLLTVHNKRFCSDDCRGAWRDDVEHCDINLPLMSHAEIALALGVSRQTVQADEARALRKLRAAIGESF